MPARSLQWLQIPPPRRTLALRPAAGGMRAARRSWVHPPHQLWGLTWTSSCPSAPLGAAGLAQEGWYICMLLAAGSTTPAPAAQRGWLGRVGGRALLSRARRGAASLLRRRSLLPPPPPSRSLVLAGAAQTCSGAAAPAPIASGLCPRDRRRGRAGVLPAGLGPLALPGKGLSWSPGWESVEGWAGGPQPAGVFRAVRSSAGSPLPAPFSRALPLSLLPSPLPPSFSHFPLPRCLHPAFSQPVCRLCPFPLSPQAFSLPLALSFPISTSSLPFSSSTFLSFPALPLFLFLPSFAFPVPSLSRPLLFPPHYPVFHSSIPFLFILPPTLVPSFRPASLFPWEGKDCQVCVCSGGAGAQPQIPARVPSSWEEREERTVGRVLSPPPLLRPLGTSASPGMKFWRPGLMPRAEGCPAGPSHTRPLFPLLPIPQTSTSDSCLPFRDQAASFDLSFTLSAILSLSLLDSP